jgi:hypothetical protein
MSIPELNHEYASSDHDELPARPQESAILMHCCDRARHFIVEGGTMSRNAAVRTRQPLITGIGATGPCRRPAATARSATAFLVVGRKPALVVFAGPETDYVAV